MDNLFLCRTERFYPAWFYELVADMFAIVQHWEAPVRGAARGRLFESIFHTYCDLRDLRVTERPGARTIRHERSASGFSHETDAVIGLPDLTVHFELKHLLTPLGKNELLIFNQKGLDHFLGGGESFRETPFYRVILSGHILTPEARRFALQWGIIVIEPDRLPLLLIHDLAGRIVPRLRSVGITVQDEIWSEVPSLLSPLQRKISGFSQLMGTGQRCILDFRLDRAIDFIQRVVGDQYWMALDANEPQWLEQRYDALNEALDLDVGLVDVREFVSSTRR